MDQAADLRPTPGNGHDIEVTGRLPRTGEAACACGCARNMHCTCRHLRVALVMGPNVVGSGLRSFFGRYFRASIVLVCAGFSAVVLVLCVLAGVHFKTGGRAGILSRDRQYLADPDGRFRRRRRHGGRHTQRACGGDGARRGFATPHEAELHRLLAGYALPPSMIGPAVLDRDGTLIASARAADVPNISLKDRNTFRVHADAPNAIQPLYRHADARPDHQ